MRRFLIVTLMTAVAAAASVIFAFAAEPAVTYTRGENEITLNGSRYALTEIFADANGDGRFDAGDARYILRLSAKLESFSEPEYFDISGDGSLDAADARIALRYTAKLDKIYTDAKNRRPSGLYKGRDGSVYAFTNYGSVITGLYKADGLLYYFDSNGSAASETFKTVDGNTYYFDRDCAAVSEYFVINDDLYYFYPDTFIMAKDTTIDGLSFGPDGRSSDYAVPDPGAEEYTPDSETLSSSIYKRAQQAVKANGLKTPEDVYSFVHGKHRFRYIESGFSHDQIERLGWTYFADYAFDNYDALCYYYAAEYAILLDAMGIENRIVHGTGHYESEHYWNQAVVNGEWINYDACNGYCTVTDDYLKNACIINDRYEGKAGYTFEEYIDPVFR